MHYVDDASYAGGHRVKVVFEDGVVGLVDLADYLEGPIFAPLRDLSYFRQFRLNRDTDTIEWPNGADFSPDFLYEVATVAGGPRHRAETA